MSVRTSRRSWLTGAGLVAGGLVAGAVLAGTMSANASTPAAVTASTTSTTTSPTPSAPSGAGTIHQGGPGVQENDGIPESQEHHGGGALDQSGTVTAVGSDSVTIKSSSGTTTYKVTSSSDIDKNGEAQLSDLVVGDSVRFSVESGSTSIDKLHAGDEAKDMPSGPPSGGTSGPSA